MTHVDHRNAVLSGQQKQQNVPAGYVINWGWGYFLACLQAVTGGFIAENPFRSLIGRHLGFLRRALPLASLLRVAYYPKWRPRKANTGFSRRRKTTASLQVGYCCCELCSVASFQMELTSRWTWTLILARGMCPENTRPPVRGPLLRTGSAEFPTDQ